MSDMKKTFSVFAIVVALLLAISSLASAAVPVDTGGYSGVIVPGGSVAEAEYSGIGGVALDSVEFNGDTWGNFARSGAPANCLGDINDNQCRWFYPDYQQNCLSPTTTGAAWQVLWIYDSTRDPNLLWHRSSTANLADLRRLLRGSSSIYAASSEIDLIQADGSVWADHKAASHEPRFITTAGGASTACHVAVTDVPVPATVLHKHLGQVNDHSVYSPGLAAYLNDIGYTANNRDYLLLTDSSGDLYNHCNPDNPRSMTPGAMAVGPGIHRSLWGPYGTGQPSDLIANPEDPNNARPDWGGGFAEICVNNPYMNTISDPNHWKAGGFAHNVAHEMGHLMGLDPKARNFINSTSHIDNEYGVMGPNQGEYCGNMNRSGMRMDCNHDQYWSAIGYNQNASWIHSTYRAGDVLVRQTPMWSASQNAFLWGGPKPTSYSRYDIRLTGFDCVNLGGCYN